MNSSDKRLVWIALLILILFLSPFLLLQKDVVQISHDNLDSNHVWSKVLAESGQIFGNLDGVIEQRMGGLPRSSYATEWNVTSLLYLIFPAFAAGTVNLILIHFIAFFSMLFLLRKHFFREGIQDWLLVAVALCFSLLPYKFNNDLSIAGGPLLFLVFLNIRAGEKKWTNWALIIFFAFYSSVIFSGTFYIIVLGLIWLRDLYKTRKFNYQFVAAIALLCISYLLVEYRLIYDFLINPDFVSHRTEFQNDLLRSPLNIKGVVIVGAMNFLHGSYTSESLQFPFMLPFAIIVLGVAFYKKDAGRKMLLRILILMGFIGLFSAIKDWDRMVNFNNFFLFKIFQYDRFHVLNAILIHFAFFFSLLMILKWIPKQKWIVIGLVTVQIAIAFYTKPSFANLFQGSDSPSTRELTYREFYSEDLYKNIQEYIGADPASYRVGSIALLPRGCPL